MCSGLHRFRFFIDNEFAADGFTSYNQLSLTLTLNVSRGTHQLRIAKINDGSKGEAIVQSIALSSGGKCAPPCPLISHAPGMTNVWTLVCIPNSMND